MTAVKQTEQKKKNNSTITGKIIKRVHYRKIDKYGFAFWSEGTVDVYIISYNKACCLDFKKTGRFWYWKEGS
jgi:hypothetical protein